MGRLKRFFNWLFPCRYNEPLCKDNLFGCRCGKGGGTSYIQQPAAPAYEMTPEEKRLLQLQSQILETTIPGQESYIRDILPLEQARAKSMFGFTEPIMRGENLPGVYGILGQPMGEAEEAELFKRGRERTFAELNKLGILDSGVTAELLNKESTAIAMESAARRRAELSNLINLAMGVPMTALPAAQTAAQTATGTVMGMGQGQREYQLAGRPTYGYAQGGGSPLGSMLGQIGGTVGGIGMSKFMFGIPCFSTDTLVLTDTGFKSIAKVKVGEEVFTNNGFKKIVKILKHKGNPNFMVNSIKTTTTHPFVMADARLIKAKYLKKGDILFGGIKVRRVKNITSSKEGLYNLDIEGHRYYVDNVLVHSGMEI